MESRQASLKAKISTKQRDEILNRIKPMVDLKQAVKDADMIIEVVPEIMEFKADSLC